MVASVSFAAQPLATLIANLMVVLLICGPKKTRTQVRRHTAAQASALRATKLGLKPVTTTIVTSSAAHMAYGCSKSFRSKMVKS